MIKFVQLDPNGLCNAGCWFCPVSTLKNPKSGINQMSPEILEKIFRDLTERRKEGLVTAEFLYFSHYNEVFLYKHFDTLVDLMVKYEWTAMFLSNGTTMSKKRIDKLIDNKRVVGGICVNSPCYTRDRFEARTGMKPKLLDNLINNVNYAIDNNLPISLVINGIDDRSNVIRGKEFPKDLKDTELKEELERAKTLFPSILITDQPHLIDRAGLLDEVITNHKSNNKVIGCHGNRELEWLHINANADVFICCNDFFMEYTFGNLAKQNIRDIWLQDDHLKAIDKAYNSLCTTCASAKTI